MPRMYWLRQFPLELCKTEISATHRWGLPGVHCPTCGVTWSDGSDAYPSVDLTSLPERNEFEKPRPEPYAEFARLREIVRPLMPVDVTLRPGTELGPLVGTASGPFEAFDFLNPWTMLVQREPLERLQAEGVRGLKGCRTALRFRRKNPPELLELEIHPYGQLHPDCLPPDRVPPCRTCGREGLRLPDEPILDAASLPTHTDLFRVGNYTTVLIGSECFEEAVRRLGLKGIVCRELPLR